MVNSEDHYTASGSGEGGAPKLIAVDVKVEFCTACGYSGKCQSLSRKICRAAPTAQVTCLRGRQGSFEISINDVAVYSKLQTKALPDYDEVVTVVQTVSGGGPITRVKGEQPIICAIL